MILAWWKLVVHIGGNAIVNSYLVSKQALNRNALLKVTLDTTFATTVSLEKSCLSAQALPACCIISWYLYLHDCSI